MIVTPGDTDEHPLFQTHDFRGRCIDERPCHGRRRLSVRAPVSPPYVGHLFRPTGRRAPMAQLVLRLRRDVLKRHRLHFG
jgi:hypothetical protein